MENIIEFLEDNISTFFAGFISLLLFFLGRYTAYRDDQRKGMKEINENFYQPFITIYDNARRAVALYVSDLPVEVQEELFRLLISYQYCCSPKLKQKIMFFNITYTGYSQELAAGNKLTEEENEFIDKSFFEIYNIIEKNLIKNSRKLYCSIAKSFFYWLFDFFANVKVNILILKQHIREKRNKKQNKET